MKNIYKISNNDGKMSKKKRKTPKAKTPQTTPQTPKKIVRLKWEDIENMSFEELDIYLCNTFKINDS